MFISIFPPFFFHSFFSIFSSLLAFSFLFPSYPVTLYISCQLMQFSLICDKNVPSQIHSKKHGAKQSSCCRSQPSEM
jgi:hypothetical protein